jgi:hypothetical protein
MPGAAASSTSSGQSFPKHAHLLGRGTWGRLAVPLAANDSHLAHRRTWEWPGRASSRLRIITISPGRGASSGLAGRSCIVSAQEPMPHPLYGSSSCAGG